MKAVLQRVRCASVTVAGRVVGELGCPGLVALVAVHKEDSDLDAQKMAKRVRDLRILEGEQSVGQTGSPVLMISQFTLCGKTKKGSRPSWSDAAPAAMAEPLFEKVVQLLREQDIHVETGTFGAKMDVSLVNSGPFTVLVDTRE